MRSIIYFIVIVLSFVACKQNSITETTSETSVVTDSALTTVQTVEQPKKTPKLDLPFIGKRWYDFGEGILNAGADGGGVSPNYYVEIKEDGSVYFGMINIENRTKKQYPSEKPVYAGNYQDIIPCAYKGSDEDNICVSDYYKITSNMIYKVDKSGNVLSDEVCCNTMFPNGACKCETKLEKNHL
jgi:hypothetical protein